MPVVNVLTSKNLDELGANLQADIPSVGALLSLNSFGTSIMIQIFASADMRSIIKPR